MQNHGCGEQLDFESMKEIYCNNSNNEETTSFLTIIFIYTFFFLFYEKKNVNFIKTFQSLLLLQEKTRKNLLLQDIKERENINIIVYIK